MDHRMTPCDAPDIVAAAYELASREIARYLHVQIDSTPWIQLHRTDVDVIAVQGWMRLQGIKPEGNVELTSEMAERVLDTYEQERPPHSGIELLDNNPTIRVHDGHYSVEIIVLPVADDLPSPFRDRVTELLDAYGT